MNLKEFKEISTPSEFNTNNDWGFGGERGISYTFKDAIFEDGYWDYRHAKSEGFHKFRVGGLCVIKDDFLKHISKFN